MLLSLLQAWRAKKKSFCQVTTEWVATRAKKYLLAWFYLHSLQFAPLKVKMTWINKTTAYSVMHDATLWWNIKNLLTMENFMACSTEFSSSNDFEEFQ